MTSKLDIKESAHRNYDCLGLGRGFDIIEESFKDAELEVPQFVEEVSGVTGNIKREVFAAIQHGARIDDRMKITGHTSPAMLRKYIKAEQLKVVEKITDQYDYFD